MARLVIVSNRVPIPKARGASAGGLAVALRDLLTPGTMWFGWSGRLASEPAVAAGAGRGARRHLRHDRPHRRRPIAASMSASPTARCGRCCISASA